MEDEGGLEDTLLRGRAIQTLVREPVYCANAAHGMDQAVNCPSVIQELLQKNRTTLPPCLCVQLSFLLSPRPFFSRIAEIDAPTQPSFQPRNVLTTLLVDS